MKKEEGDIEGGPFELHELQNCEVLLLDYSEMVQIEDLVDCRVFIGACSGTVLVRHCEGCSFTVACESLQIHNCDSCTFSCAVKGRICSDGEKPFEGGPYISDCANLRFAPFNGAYPGHAAHMASAGLNFVGATVANVWFDVEDQSQNRGTFSEKSWRLLDASEEEDIWSVEAAVKMTTPTIPRVAPGEYPKLGAVKISPLSGDQPVAEIPKEPVEEPLDPNSNSRIRGVTKLKYVFVNGYTNIELYTWDLIELNMFRCISVYPEL